MRERNRRKGIIDIDSDDGEPGKQIPTDEEEEDSEGDSTSSADVENFIVEDDGLVDEEEMDRIHRMMPSKLDHRVP